MPTTVFYDGTRFLIKTRTKILIKGFIDADILSRISNPKLLLDEMAAFTDRLAGGSLDAAKEALRQKLGEDLPNFLFISAIMDYGNIATSRTLQLVLLDLYKKYPFLFRPNDRFWDDLLKNDQQAEAWRVLETLLLPLSGLFRTDFLDVVVPNWVGIIKFLRDSCEGDASNFFNFACRKLGLSENDPNALRKFQERMFSKSSVDRLKEELGIEFSLGPKTGSLLLSLMTENGRGFGVLRGVNREQTAKLAPPVDSAVIRVMLNTGLVKITHVNPQRKEGRFTRSILTAVCQRSMELMAGRLELMPIELDEYIWSIGTTACKHRGKFCYICPLTVMCDSWIYGYVKESSGAKYRDRCFSFARPQTQKNALYLRGCETCPHQGQCRVIDETMATRHPTYNEEYSVRKFSSQTEKIRDEDIARIIQNRNMN